MVDLERFRSGEKEEWEALVRRYGPMVSDMASRYADGPDDAEDMAQEAWALAFRKRRSFRGTGSVLGWLAALTRNHCLSRLRRRKRRTAVLDLFRREGRDPPPNPLQTLEEQDRRQLVRDAISNLPKRQREAVTLRHGEGLSTSEIAQIMGVSEVSVRSLISKGLARIAQEIRRIE